MGVSTRTATAVHALTFLAHWANEGVQSSARIAESLDSNPVLVRRILGSLRDAGLVYAMEGSGGGWQLARSPEAISLWDAYSAVEQPDALLPTHAHEPSRNCVIGRHAPAVLKSEFAAAELALRERLTQTSIAEVLGRVVARERASTP